MSTVWAVPGAKCVCIDGDGVWYDDFDEPSAGPMRNDIVTVASYPIVDNGTVCIRLVGWPDANDMFQLASFKPLVTQAEDAALFASILAGLPVKVDA